MIRDTAALADAYRGRRCLVLGADGFIGRWVARALATAGADVHAAVLDAGAATATLRRFAPRARLLEADLLPPGSVRALIERADPATVFNLAGYGVREGEADERRAERMNTGLVEELCDALSVPREPGRAQPALVHVGSAAEYGGVGGRLDEDGDAQPSTLYGRTKLAGTRAALRAASAGVPAVVARPFTVFGPGEPPHRLLPSLLRAARSGAPLDLSAGLQKRDFTYVEDVAEGLLRLGAAPAARGTAVNLCTGTLLAVRDFVVTAAGELGIADEALRFGVLPGGLHDMEHEAVTIDRLVALVGWRPGVDVAEGVRRTRDFETEGPRDVR